MAAVARFCGPWCADLVQRYADITRQEYLAAGIRVALHRQIDLATEPRWARTGMTFGEDADLTSRLVIAYIRGFQGAVATSSSGVGVLIPETGRPAGMRSLLGMALAGCSSQHAS